MTTTNSPTTADFIDRRNTLPLGVAPNFERRQFASSYADLSPEAAELGRAIDRYKLMNRRRYVTYEEILTVIKQLGYSRPQ